jgi:hypothetical protein
MTPTRPATEEPVCEKPGCANAAIWCCDRCNVYFCSDHGSRCRKFTAGAKLEHLCWKCGGFDRDGKEVTR